MDLDSFNSSKEEIILVTLVTTSRSSNWTPAKVVTDGSDLVWKASADGFVDQVIQTNGAPVFDLSLSRDSDVKITASTLNNQGSLVELIINSLNIKELSIENSPALSILSCTDNQIKTLNLQNNILLKDLYCHSNQLEKLDLGKNINLLNLACFSNQISSIDFKNNTLLSTISCSGNLLLDLDLSNNRMLKALECDYNKLQSLNIQNGNNSLIQKFNSKNNLDLTCIQVDDKGYSDKNWPNIDPWTEFSTDCTFTNEPPVAIEDYYEVNENDSLFVDSEKGVLSNDYDPDEDVFMAMMIDDVNNGELIFFADGGFEYIPLKGFFGTDTFSYRLNDGEYDSNVARVTIHIEMINESPIANDDEYVIFQNEELRVDANEGVLKNDLDADGDPLHAELLKQVDHGKLQFLSDGTFTYIPDKDFFGTDQFSYQVFDGFDHSNTATVRIIVESVSRIIVPNAFTPNNDGLNDTFRPVYVGMNTVDLQIFDTWGVLIYRESGTTLTGWNGFIKNKPAENGNYLFRIDALTKEMESMRQEGIFTLIK